MKLILAIVNNDDSAAAIGNLTREGFFVTKLSTTGGFLLAGNSTFLIGTEDNKIDRAMEILAECCSERESDAPRVGHSQLNGSLPEKIKIGGATVFVLSVDQYKKL